MKKGISLILSLVLMLSSTLFFESSVFANDNITIYSNYSESVTAGGALKLPVYINNNSGFMGFRINIGYDSEVLTPVSVEYGDVFSSGLQDNIDSDAFADSFKVYWSGTENNTENGILFYVNFNVDSTASVNTTVKLSYSQEDTFDEDYEDILFDCQDVDLSIVNNNYSSYAKVTANTNDATVGNSFSVALKLSELKELSSMQLTLAYSTETFEFVSADSNANITSVNNNGNVVLDINGITSEMNNTDFVTVNFKCKESVASGEYAFGLSSEAEDVFCKGCAVKFKPSTSSEAAVIYADETTADKNDTLDVPVKISNNHGIMGYMLHFEYNSEELEIISVTSGASFVGSFENNIGDKNGEFDVLWTGSSAIDENGTILNLKFKVVTDKELTSTIKTRYSQDDTFNEEYKDVILDCKDITVKLNLTQSSGDPGTTEPTNPGGGNNEKPVAPIKTVKLKTTKYVYNGKVQTPAVIIKDADGKTVSSKYYTVKYANGRKNVGKYSVKVTFKDKYSGSKTLYFTIIPKGTSITKVVPKKDKVLVKWKKQTKQVTGYQIQYSTSKNFKNKKTITIKKNKTTSKTIKGLKTNKRYYIRIRTYKTVNGKKYYSNWSKIKSVKLK